MRNRPTFFTVLLNAIYPIRRTLIAKTVIMEHTLATLLLCGVWFISTSNTQTTQRFQAEKFLDMLGKSYDSKHAYVDLLSALHKRLNLESATQTNGSSTTVDGGATNSNAMAETAANCPEATPRQGASITYTSQSRIPGSRALYQCDPGYDGQSKFIQCGSGGQWTPLGNWEGCIPVDCGSTPPGVQNADSSFTSTKFQSVVVYTCQTGYKMNVTNANITCQDTGFWDTPTFACEKDNTPSNPMLAALMQSMPGFANMPNFGAAGSPSMLPSSMTNNNPMAAMFAQMFQKTAQTPPSTPAPTTTTTPAAKVMPGGFQLPSHLQNLLPNGLSSTSGMRPQDLMTLASLGLGSNNPAAAPRDLNQLLGTMNPMSLFGGAMGLNMGGAGAGGLGAGTGPGGVPPDPERMAEQREEMMMRAMMASAMKSMMGPGSHGNSSGNTNPASDMMTLMALQSGIGGGGAGAGAGGAAGGFDPLSMMLGGMGGGAAGGGLFGSLFA